MAKPQKFTKEEIEAAEQAIAAEQKTPVSFENENFSEEEIAAAQKELAKEEPVQAEKPSNKKEYGPVRTFAMHGAQSVSLGFADEGAGLLKAIDSLPENLRKPDTLKATIAAYKAGKEEAMASLNESESQNPNAALLGQATGYLVPTGLAAKGAKMGVQLGRAAVIGAARGVGKSESDNVPGLVADAASGSLENVGAQLAFGAAKGGGGLLRDAIKSPAARRVIVNETPILGKFTRALERIERAKAAEAAAKGIK